MKLSEILKCAIAPEADDPSSFTGPAVYLLSLSKPLGGTRHKAKWYVGSAANLSARLRRHQQGNGAAITKACIQKGIGFECVRYWTFSTAQEARAIERRIKQQKNHSRFAPVGG